MENLLFIGLGRIGLPQALVFAKKGFTVYGYDNDPQVVRDLEQKQTPFFEPHMDEYLHDCLGDRLFPLSEWGHVQKILNQVDAIFFTLGTAAPDSKSCLQYDAFDLTAIQTVLEDLFANKSLLQKGVKLIFRTTLPLGSIDRMKEFIESKFALVEGDDFHLAFVPERLIEGQAIVEEETLPKIIGAFSERGYSQVKSIFEKVGGKIIRVENPTAAEFCKLADNSFRNTMFSFSNEIAMWASHVGVDVLEVIRAINKDYQRNAVPLPGFVSGYCLGKDPYIFEYGFSKVADNRNFNSIWYNGRRTNDYLLNFTVDRIVRNLKKLTGGQMEDCCVSILGMSFKEDVDDFRMSHSIMLAELLVEQGIRRLRVFDPNMDKNKYTRMPKSLEPYVEFKSNYLSQQVFDGAHAVLIAHRHNEIVEANKKSVLGPLLACSVKPVYIFDGWNVWREAVGLDTVTYEALGYGAEIAASEVGVAAAARG
jgi:UDP-N-acetyl-D-mannosaminuronic acid dehydrogenase